MALLKIIGGHVLAASLMGVAALPKLPFAASLVVSLMLILAGYGH